MAKAGDSFNSNQSCWYSLAMKNFGKVSRIRKIVGWLFLGSGIFNLLGLVVSADGAGLGVGIFNTVVGVLFLSPGVKSE